MTRKGIVCVQHLHHKKGLCKQCNVCIKFPPSPSCIEPGNHLRNRKRGRPRTDDTVSNLTTPSMKKTKKCEVGTRSSSESCNHVLGDIGDVIEDSIGHLYGNSVVPETLFTESKMSTVLQIFSTLNLPKEYINKIPSEGITKIRINGRELRRAKLVITSVVESLIPMLLQDECEASILRDSLFWKSYEVDNQMHGMSCINNMLYLSLFGGRDISTITQSILASSLPRIHGKKLLNDAYLTLNEFQKVQVSSHRRLMGKHKFSSLRKTYNIIKKRRIITQTQLHIPDRLKESV